MAGLYLHIPFCKRVCAYCDFYKSADLRPMKAVVEAMHDELRREAGFLPAEQLRTIYFGGGTPSLLPPEELEEFIAHAAELFDCTVLEECTVEANPDDLTPDYLRRLARTRVDRLSIGVQSFDDGELRLMNRRHTADAARKAVRQAQEAGFGNVTWGICKKATQLGAKVVTLSGPDGYIYDPDGVATEEKIAYLVEMRSSGRNRVQDYAEKFGVEFFPGEKPWGVKADVVMPSAMQNDVHMEQAKQIAANGVKYYIEVANMPTTNDALRFLMEQPGMIVAPSKAVNAGGVATSALEMAQNSERLVWTEEEVDQRLRQIMNNIYTMSVEAAEKYGLGYNLVAGANIAGFQRVADAMMAQGIF